MVALDLWRRSFTGRNLNGRGVYRDPLAPREDLRYARVALDNAIETLNAVPAWPINQEYDAADERRHTRR